MGASALWWLGPAFLLALLMLVSMMQFTGSLLLRRPRRRRSPASAAELQGRLLALEFGAAPVSLTNVGPGALEIRDYDVDESWTEGLAGVTFSVAYCVRMLLDEARHELRWFESVRARTLFLGFDGWRPRFRFNYWYRGGQVDLVWRVQVFAIQPGFPPHLQPTAEFEMDTVALKREIVPVVNKAGWAFRPVSLPFYASSRWLSLTRRVVPEWLQRVPERKLWGIVYPASYLLLIGYLAGAARLVDPGAWSTHNLLVMLLVSAGWWGVWGLLTWMLTGFPGLRRLRRARSK